MNSALCTVNSDLVYSVLISLKINVDWGPIKWSAGSCSRSLPAVERFHGFLEEVVNAQGLHGVRQTSVVVWLGVRTRRTTGLASNPGSVTCQSHSRASAFSNVGTAVPAAGLWGLGQRLSSCKGSINVHLLELATIPCFGTYQIFSDFQPSALCTDCSICCDRSCGAALSNRAGG